MLRGRWRSRLVVRHKICGGFTRSLATCGNGMLRCGLIWWCGHAVVPHTARLSTMHSEDVLLKVKMKTKMLLPREPSRQTQIFSILAGALYPPAGG